MILLLIPLTLFIGVYCFGGKRYYFISLLILLECMLPFFLIFEGRKPQARELVLIAVLVALNVAGRAAFFMLPEFKPVVAMTILAGVAFGGETGFLVGAMTMLVSNMLFSQGPWTPWQMFAMGIIGWLAGILYRKGVLRRSKLSLCIFGVIASTVIFGGIMNPASALMWSNTVNWKIIMSYYVTGIPDREKRTKDDIVIEMRDPAQVLSYRGIPNTLPGVKAIYPSFDVVPPHLISGVVTDKGVYVPYLLGNYFDSDVKPFY